MSRTWKTLLQPQSFWKLFQAAFNAWNNDKIPRHGAALAYYTVLSLVPLLIVMISLIGLIFGREAAQKHILDQTTNLMGPQSADAIRQMIEHASQPSTGTIAMVVGVATLLVGASGVFAQLQDSLNTIWGVEPKEGRGLWGIIRDRFMSVSAVLGTGFLLLVSLVLSAGLAAFGKWYGGWLPAPEFVLQVLDVVISLLVISGLFTLMFKILPDARIAWGDVWVGALLTAVLFTIGKFAIGLYLGKTDVGSAYGSAGSLVIMLVWIYYSAQIVLFGAEFTQVYANEIGARIVPTDKAVVSDPAKAGSLRPTPGHPRPQSAAGSPALRQPVQYQPGDELPWWGTVLLLWVAVTRFPRRSE